jgi:hypothetical protein
MSIVRRGRWIPALIVGLELMSVHGRAAQSPLLRHGERRLRLPLDRDAAQPADPQYEALVTQIHDATLKAGRKLGGPQMWMNRQGFSFFQGTGETNLIKMGAQVSLGGSGR